MYVGCFDLRILKDKVLVLRRRRRRLDVQNFEIEAFFDGKLKGANLNSSSCLAINSVSCKIEFFLHAKFFFFEQKRTFEYFLCCCVVDVFFAKISKMKKLKTFMSDPRLDKGGNLIVFFRTTDHKF